jgi:hypothetical protein
MSSSQANPKPCRGAELSHADLVSPSWFTRSRNSLESLEFRQCDEMASKENKDIKCAGWDALENLTDGSNLKRTLYPGKGIQGIPLVINE